MVGKSNERCRPSRTDNYTGPPPVTVTLRLDQFGPEALEDYLRGTGGSLADAFEASVSYYLGDSDSGRLAWRVRRHRDRMDPSEPLEIELSEDLLGDLRRESRRQRVTPDLLAVHALMYYLADLDSGRAAARVGEAVSPEAEGKL
jgi:hypothetical protein